MTVFNSVTVTDLADTENLRLEYYRLFTKQNRPAVMGAPVAPEHRQPWIDNFNNIAKSTNDPTFPWEPSSPISTPE